ncbi:hypothetical protein PFISCL1PPCAC_5525, partial [Pristionchus fissidentatus]
MPPAEPAPDLSSGMLSGSHSRIEEKNDYSKWKEVADELKMAGFPMNLAASFRLDHIPIDSQSVLRKKAHQLDLQIESLMTPLDDPLKVDEAILAIRTAICQGMSKEKFEKLMADHNFSLKCNVIWESDAIAYRCNTCSLTPCMSLCATCFKGGDHEGHDVTRFFSREGGACDCGNEDVLKEGGFCSKHGAQAERPPPPPPTIVSLAELIMLRVLMRVLDHFRTYKQHNENERVPKYMLMNHERGDQVCGAGKLITLLQECVDYGGPIRDAFAKILIDKEIEKSIWQAAEPGVGVDSLSTPSFRNYRENYKFFQQVSSEDLEHSMLDEYFPDFPKKDMTNTCFLHELLFWMQVRVFPQSLINLTLAFLGDTEYRDEFARRFFLLYPWTSDAMRAACEADGVEHGAISNASSRIIHVSVQMLSSAALCSRLTDEINLPRLMFGSVAYLLLSSDQRAVPIKPLGKEYGRNDETRAAYGFEPNPVENEEEDGEDEIEREEEGEVMGEDEMRAETERIIGLIREQHRELARVLLSMRPNLVARARHLETLADGPDMGDRLLEYLLEDEEPPERRRERRESERRGQWMTIDVEKSKVIRNHGYWFAMGDTQNLLSHPEVVVKMCRDETTMEIYFRVVEKMQCMDSISRIVTGDHLHNDIAEDHQRTLVLEYEMCASSMFNLVYGIVARSDDEAAEAFYRVCWSRLKNWFYKMDLEHAGKPLQLGRNTVTYHIPLSRHFSTLISYTDSLPSINSHLSHLCTEESKEFLHVLMLHPLRIHAARCEWSTSMWVRNGQQMRIPACLYSQTHMLSSYYVPDLDLMRLCAANLQPVDVLHALFESFSLGDVFRWKLETGTSGVFFSSDASLSLKRLEWVDTMVFGCLRLMAELVVLPGVGEQTDEESMRDDIVCKLAMMEMPHSRLRQSMAEKGSHGSEITDKYFEKILAQVADFSDPEQDESLDQGEYSLSQKAQMEYLCPLLVMGRATSLRAASSALQRLEQVERRLAGRPEHQVKDVWVPYRLPSFPSAIDGRSPFVKGIYRLIVHERLLETACYMLYQYTRDSLELERRLSGESPSDSAHEFTFKEQTMQLLIYLLSVGLLYMRTQPEAEEWRDRFHTDLSDEQSPNRSLGRSILSIGSVFMCSNMKRGEMSKEEEEKRIREMMREAVKNEIKERLVAGTPAEYYGRLLAILYRDDDRFRVMMDVRFPETVEQKMEVDERQDSPKESTPNTLLAKKRAAAEALKRRILEDKKRKGGETMRKLMEEEQMTQEDLDRLDVTDKAVELYECPICGDETPASFDQPIGLLVYMQFNGSYLNSIDATTSDQSLLEVDEDMRREEEEGGAGVKERYRKHARYWREKSGEIEPMVSGNHCDMMATPSWLEVKTCGHHAHISCLAQYRETVTGRRHRHDVLFCPKCRFPTNGLLPLRVRTGVEVNIVETLTNGSSDDRLAVFDTLTQQLQQLQLSDRKGTPEKMAQFAKPTRSYSIGTIRHLVVNNLSNRGDEAERFLEENSHVLLQGLLINNINRNIFVDAVGVNSVRPKCIDIVTEHLNFHSALTLTKDEIAITRAHVRELMMEEPSELYIMNEKKSSPKRSKWSDEDDEKERKEEEEEHDPMEGTSGDMVGRRSEREEKKIRKGKIDLANMMRGMPQEDLLALFPTKKRPQDASMEINMQKALTHPSLTDAERRNALFYGLDPTPRSEVRARFSAEWKRRCTPGKDVCEYDNRLPALFVRPLSMAARMTSVMMTSELNRESMLESLHVVARRLIVMAAIRWQLMAACAMDYGSIREWAEERREGE